MHRLWLHRDVVAPAPVVWTLLSDVGQWPRWGPSVRGATIDGPFADGTTGTVRTIGGLRLGFKLIDVVDGEHWGWIVGGVRATTHSLEPVTDGRCRVGFSVPWPAAPYLTVCALALRRIEALATGR